MTWWQRLRKEEDGNVLYLTLIMILLLSAFTLVLVNVLYIGVMKVKAQNAADQLALSAGTLKARVLNRVTDDNAILFISRRFGTVTETAPYISILELIGGLSASFYAVGHFGKLVYDFHHAIQDDHILDRIAEGNGLVPGVSRYALFPVDAWHLLGGVVYDVRPVPWINTFPPMAGSAPILFSLGPSHDWYVQSRVEIQTRTAIIGGARLGFELPDIVTRARAQIYATSVPGPPELARYWKVRLAQPNDDVDRYIRDRIGSPQTGANSGAYPSYTQPGFTTIPDGGTGPIGFSPEVDGQDIPTMPIGGIPGGEAPLDDDIYDDISIY